MRKRFFVFSTLSDLISDLVVDAVVLIERLAVVVGKGLLLPGVFIVVCDLAWERLFLAALRASIPLSKGVHVKDMCFLGTHATVLVLCIRKIGKAYGSTLETE